MGAQNCKSVRTATGSDGVAAALVAVALGRPAPVDAAIG